MSDCPWNMPMGISKFLLGRWKFAGGGTCWCVAVPGCAHSGTAGVGEGEGEGEAACARNRCGAVENIRTSSHRRQEGLRATRTREFSIAKNCITIAETLVQRRHWAASISFEAAHLSRVEFG